MENVKVNANNLPKKVRYRQNQQIMLNKYFFFPNPENWYENFKIQRKGGIENLEKNQKTQKTTEN